MQLLGFTALIIAGVSLRFVSLVYGLQDPKKDRQPRIFAIMNISLVLNVTSYVAVLTTGNLAWGVGLAQIGCSAGCMPTARCKVAPSLLQHYFVCNSGAWASGRGRGFGAGVAGASGAGRKCWTIRYSFFGAGSDFKNSARSALSWSDRPKLKQLS